MDICLLPTEILENIFSYLNTADILNLRSLNTRFSDISTSRSVISKVKLFNNYDFNTDHLINFFGKSPACNNITSFNITSTYWIAAADLRRCITNMNNLERLYVMDTKLGLTKPDIQVYRNLPKLRRLGVTLLRKTLCKEAIQNFPPLTHLYFHLHTSVSILLQTLLRMICKSDVLEELWVVEIGLPVVFEWLLLSVPRNISSLTISTMNFSCERDSLKCSHLSNLFMSNVTDQQCSYGKLPKKTPLLWDREISDPNWSYIIKLRQIPFSPRQFEEIFFDDAGLSRIQFDEINLVHPDLKCADNYLTHIGDLLLYDSMRNLKKLGLNYCCCLSDDESTIVQPLKRLKREAKTATDSCLLSKIAERSTGIEELELWTCDRTINNLNITNGTLENIAKFKSLSKLTLDNIPPLVSGAFLIKVLTECKQLVSLHIKSKQQNTQLHNMLCKALQSAINLKDLRYEHPCNISIDRLFESLVTNKDIRLSRLFIKCRSVEVFSAKPFKSFLEANPDLTFLYIVIKDLPQAAIKNVKKSLDKYRTDPRKIFTLEKNEQPYESTVNIPQVHLYQMIKLASRVSTIDVFNDFDK